MAKRSWRIEVEGRQHVVDMQVGTTLGFGTGGGHVAVDSKVIQSWGSSFFTVMPKHLSFEVEGKKGEIRRKGIWTINPVMYFDGKEIRPFSS